MVPTWVYKGMALVTIFMLVVATSVAPIVLVICIYSAMLFQKVKKIFKPSIKDNEKG